MKLGRFIALGATLLCVTALFAEEVSEAIDFSEIKCVVSGRPVNPEATAEYEGGEVYFCCPGCPGAFAKDTEKFAAKANHQLVATDQAEQIGCPMSGREIDPDTTIEVAGAEIAFCCSNCQSSAEAEEDEAKQIAMVFSTKAFKKAFKVKTDEE